MKRILFSLLVVTTAQLVNAQNVGIGTNSPSSKLHLVGNFLQESGSITLNNASSIIQLQNAGINKAYVQLSGDNLRLGTNGGNQPGKTIIRMAGQDRVLIDSTGNTQILGLQDASLTSNGYITLGSVTGRNMILDNNEIIVRDNGGIDNLILQNDGGNVGIGVASPTAKLHVNGDFKITDGTEANRRVLTSDASGNASWQNAAFSNNDRIMVRYNGYGTDSLIDGTTTLYDNGGISFSLINTIFTVTKSGLYHFEGTMASTKTADYSNTPPYYITMPRIAISVNGGSNFELASAAIFYTHNELSSIGTTAKITLPFNIDIYLAAGATVKFKLGDYLSYLLGGANKPGYISAYLISE